MPRKHYRPAWWLPSAHAQTLWAPLRRDEPRPLRRTERIELPDSDFIDLFWHGDPQPQQPLVLAIHGLTGSADSPYIRGLQHTLGLRGIASVAMHLRGAGAEPNRLARMYHSGDTADLGHVITLLASRGYNRLMAAGYSLGGNVLLKWLGENGPHARLMAAAAISVPFQLDVVADTLDLGISRLYRDHMMGELKATMRRKREWARERAPRVHERLTALGNIDALTRFREWDDAVVAPLNGFASADDYYARCSSRAFVSSIRVPTLIVHALDDPLMTPDVVPTRDELSEQIELETWKRGGHVGFVSGRHPLAPDYWLDRRIADHFSAQLFCN